MESRVRDIMMRPHDSVGDALRRMDASGSRIVLVIDEEDRLLGVATDGDMRRWIISGQGLDGALGSAMNPHPHSLESGYRREDAERFMARRHFECLPVLDAAGRVVDAVWWHDLMEEDRRGAGRSALGVPVVMMAGGEGRRLAPYTDVLPKALVPVGGTPIAQLIMERFAEWGCDEFLLMLNHKANLIRAYFADLEVGYRVRCFVEDKPLGTAGALSLLAGQLTQTFFLTNCDILVDADYAGILRSHAESGDEITIVASMKHISIPYGVCDVGEGGRLLRMTEKPSFDYLVATGLYVVEPRVLEEIPRDEGFDMTDLVTAFLEGSRRIGVYPVSEGSWLDMGEHDPLRRMTDRLVTDERG
jgi:dTDP-glucose pyrophosphorylase